MDIQRKRPINPKRDHHNALREAILRVFIVERETNEMTFRDLYLQLDTDGWQMTPDGLKNYLEDMKERKWLDFEVQRTDRDLREFVRVRLLPRGRDVFDGVIEDPGIPTLRE